MVDEESKKLRNEVTNRNEVEFGEAKSRLGGGLLMTTFYKLHI